MAAKILSAGFPLGLAFLLIGCGGGSHSGPEKQATVPTNGILTYRGKAVPNASVVFQALDGKVSAHGLTDGAGTFRLSTYGAQDGIPPGRYKVTVAAGVVKETEPGVLPDEPEGGFKSPVPIKYANPTTTDIVLEVKDQERNEFTIDLK
ncbi:MAG: carboxypeptidase-like regulatory domain-containing protein [Gemmataceae bacterium]|nr:carboxypeptidase-like regulatory domain-containing protein [Gemmataceae bacterium]MCI0739824.1 carboxypeptidase-like regulatory domain-containing protein [Gemmataceae bacterium]